VKKGLSELALGLGIDARKTWEKQYKEGGGTISKKKHERKVEGGQNA